MADFIKKFESKYWWNKQRKTILNRAFLKKVIIKRYKNHSRNG